MNPTFRTYATRVSALFLISWLGLAPTNAQAPKATPQLDKTQTNEPQAPKSQTVDSGNDSACTLQIRIDGVIGPGTLDYLERGAKKAQDLKCKSLMALINTPGGNLQSTRLIVEYILNSEIPILCLVYPSGAHAGSAGAIIMQACHVSGGVETTNLGAATPIEGGGQDIGKDLRQKMMNDTISWVEGLAELRGRNKKFARDIVESAKVVTSKEALSIGAIDFVGDDIQTFLKFAATRSTKIGSNKDLQKIVTGPVRAYEPDLRYRLLELITHPQIAYLMFMISIGLLYFELTHPGMIVPGVVGGLGLILSLISFHMLDVRWGGVALLVLGLIFLVAEAFIPSFGALGIGGIVAFIIGSVLLFDPAVGALPLSMILPTAIGLGLLMLGVGFLALRTRKVRKTGGFNDLVGAQGRVSALDAGSKRRGQVEVRGEIWNFVADQDLDLGVIVRVESVNGFTLNVVQV